MLVEFDGVDKAIQYAKFKALGLPISAVVDQ
jgi:hypothetical protein